MTLGEMTFDEMAGLTPRQGEGAMLRDEPFGGMVASGNLPILNFNDDSLAVWRLCNGSRTVADIEAALLDEYEEEHLRERIVDLLNFCFKNGLLVDSN